MSPNVEQELLTKVNKILVLLDGGLDPANGLINRVNVHDKRLVLLERWRWYIAGGIGLLGLLLFGRH